MTLSLDGLPGEELVQLGLADLSRGVESVEGLLVALARPRLLRLGIAVPGDRVPDAELLLYRRLLHAYPRDAYGRYNALLRRLASFGRAAEQRLSAERRAAERHRAEQRPADGQTR